MTTAGGIRKLQQEAAACTDELLEISNDISSHVLPLYTGKDGGYFDLQCRLQQERCRQLGIRLEKIRGALQEAVDSPADPGLSYTGEQALAECRTSGQVTLQIIAQNLVILEQKKLLLEELLIGSGEAQSSLKAAEKLRSTADVVALQDALRKEMERCRTGNEKSS